MTERVKCIYCGEEIHISKFAGMNKKGLFCNNILCLIQLIRESEEDKLKEVNEVTKEKLNVKRKKE